MRHVATACMLLAAGLWWLPANAAKNESLDAWMDHTLIPSIVSQLSTHPRFDGDVVRFVVLDDGRPAALSNELAVALRDKLQDAVVDQSDVRVAWQVSRARFDRFAESGHVDCASSDAHYYIGIEVAQVGTARHEVSVRALDIEDQNWVSGFGGTWSGPLTAMQLRAFRKPESDNAYLGQRIVPFEETQSDLLAAQLAHDLGCALLGEMSGEYVAALAGTSDKELADMLKLVSHNLAPYQALKISGEKAASNSIIATSAHAIDDDLYQYWVTVTPTDPATDMPMISASAYIYLPEEFLAAPLVSAEKAAGLSNSAQLISALDVVQLRSAAACSRSDSRRVYDGGSGGSYDRCFALQATPAEDTVMFFLYHQLNNGLVRLSGSSCTNKAEAHVARMHEAELLPLAMDIADAPSWLPGDDWVINPDDDTFYVVATRSSKAARALATHLEQLPQRCGSSLRPGLDGPELRRWFRELDAIADHWSSDIDWQSVRVRTVY